MSRARYVIPRRVRRGALKVVGHWTARPAALVESLETRLGFHTIGELAQALSEKLGPDAEAEFLGRLSDTLADAAHPRTQPSRAGGNVPQWAQASSDPMAEAVLLSLPDHLFNAAIEVGHNIAASYAFDLHRAEEASAYVYRGISRLYADNGVPYDFDDNGRLVPTGSATVSELALQPALDVLDDPRLAQARTHLLDAQRRLAEHDPDEAVDEARMAVEYGMLALLDASGTARPAKHQPNDLFNALAPSDGSGVMSRAAEELVLAAPRFRGRTTAGHAGTVQVTQGDAEAVVGAAAAALLYLGDKLP